MRKISNIAWKSNTQRRIRTVNKQTTAAQVATPQGKRGPKPNGKKIAMAVEAQWTRIDHMVKSRLAKELPLKVSDAKRYVLRTAAEVIALASGRGRRK